MSEMLVKFLASMPSIKYRALCSEVFKFMASTPRERSKSVLTFSSGESSPPKQSYSALPTELDEFANETNLAKMAFLERTIPTRIAIEFSIMILSSNMRFALERIPARI